MGDLADFENLSALEKRLSQALDRISTGIKARDEARGAEAEAEARATEATERVSALEARLSETQDALSEAQSEATSAREEAKAARDEADTARAQAAATPAVDTDALSDLKARLEASEKQVAEMNAALAEARDALEAAKSDPFDVASDAEPEDMEKALAVMGRRVERARTERDQARTACDAATDALDELKEATGADVDARILELRRQLRQMRTRSEDLAAQVSLLQSGASVDAALLDQSLLAEVETLRQMRDTDAAELDRIVQDMQAGLDMAASEASASERTEGGQNA